MRSAVLAGLFSLGLPSCTVAADRPPAPSLTGEVMRVPPAPPTAKDQGHVLTIPRFADDIVELCASAADCGVSNACQIASCQAGQCAYTQLPAGTPMPQGKTACAEMICEGNGPQALFEAKGAPCPGGKCDGKGTCVVSGSVVWTADFPLDKPALGVAISGVRLDSAGATIVAADLYWGKTPNFHESHSMFLGKADANGISQWWTRFATNGILKGDVTGPIHLAIGQGDTIVAQTSSMAVTADCAIDAGVFATSPTGQPLWSKTGGGTWMWDLSAAGLAIAADGHVFAQFSGPSKFGGTWVGSGVVELGANGDYLSFQDAVSLPADPSGKCVVRPDQLKICADYQFSPPAMTLTAYAP